MLAFATLALLTRLPIAAQATDAPPDPQAAARLLPPSVVAYANVSGVDRVIDTVKNHPLVDRIGEMGLADAIQDAPDLDKARQGLAAFEGAMGCPWDQAIASLTEGGIHFAFDPSSQGAAMLIQSSNGDVLERFRNFALAIGQLGEGNFGVKGAMDYRGLPVFSINDELKLAMSDRWLVIVNRRALGKAILDRLLDSDLSSLATNENFVSAMKTKKPVPGSGGVTAFLDLDRVRSRQRFPLLESGKTPNIAAEALFGGLVSNLQNTPSITAQLTLNQSGVTLAFETPHRDSWGQGREYFFGEVGAASAPPLLAVPQTIFSASTHRDLSQMWLLAPDLMTDQANEQLAKADTNLTTFFSGRDFAEDILGAVEPGLQLIVAEQAFGDDVPAPAIRLPAFALQFNLRPESEDTDRELRRVFQNFVGFINVVGAMQGQPQFDLGYRDSEESRLVTATYVAPRDKTEYTSAPINYNFSPALGFKGKQMVLSSSVGLAETLLGSTDPDPRTDGQTNTAAVLHADTLASILKKNESQLIAQNMLEKGHSRDEAKGEIDLLLGLIELFDQLSMDLTVKDGRLTLSAALRVDEP